MSRIAFVSTYPPSQCGVATFTADLGRAIGAREIIALRCPGDNGRFDAEVHHVIRTDVPADHVRIARSLTDCDVRVVSVQHEFGMWGGDDGDRVLDFLDALSVPAVATLHSVPRTPTHGQRRVLDGILDLTAVAVVMSQAAAEVLVEEYAADPTRIEVIPHGVPDLPLVEPDSIKPAVDMAGRAVLLSFGLLGPNKGCETVIEAMPAIVRAIPEACYVILGATHPAILRVAGERYRESLAALVTKLGMQAHVRFVDQFVGRLELSRWLEAADVFLTPYRDLERVASGTLSYALAAGKATVSTPYPYAAEALGGGRGVLVEPGSATALGDAVVALLSDPAERSAMGARAHAYGRAMTWSQVAAGYTRLFTRLTTPPLVVSAAAVPMHRA